MFQRATRLALTFAIVFIASSCGGDSTGPENSPPPVSVATVTVDPATATLVPQQTRQLTATPRDNAGNILTERTVEWTSDNSGVASVNASGIVTATGAGNATISATSDGKSGSAIITVQQGLFITATGGTMTVDAVQVTVPAGAVSTGTAFTASPANNPPANERLVSGTAWSLGPNGATFSEPVTVRMSWTAAHESEHDPTQFAVHRWNGSAWVELDSRNINAAARTVSGQTNAFSIFAILELPGAPTPTLTSFAPDHAIAGETAFTLTATGVGLTDATVLRWNGAPRPTTFISPTSIAANIPAADIAQAGTAQITLFTPAPGGGESDALEFTIIAPNPAPSLASLNPPNVEAGSGAFTLVVAGTGFVETSEVRWNGSARPTTFVSSTELHADIPASDVASEGSAQVTVFNPPPGGGTSSAATVNITAAPPPPPPGATILAAGGEHTCGTTVDGVAYCWGQGIDGQLGTGVDPASKVPVAVLGGLSFSMLSAAGSNTCGIANNKAYCWGQGSSGHIGNSSSSDQLQPAPVSGGHEFQSISTGANYSCALTTEGKAYCWGFGADGGLGTGVVAQVVDHPVAVIGGHVFASIAVSLSHTCALKSDGSAFCWGRDDSGELGDGGGDDKPQPVPVMGGLSFSKLTVGGSHTCGLDTDGKAYCWGSNIFGQLGTGNVGGMQGQPVPVVGGHTFIDITAGSSHTCALRADGAAFCWGTGQLGDGVTGASATPVQVGGGHSFTELAANSFKTCGIAGGNTYCWGRGAEGGIGDGELEDRLTPTLVSGGHTFVDVWVGDDHTCALTVQGAAWCWGRRNLGQLGDGKATVAPRPTAVVGGHNFAQVTSGFSHSCALTPAGNAFCWGDGDVGQLGIGVNESRNVPEAVMGGLSFKQISAGFQHTCALADDGTAYCWGVGQLGQLGHGSGLPSAVPVAVVGGHKFTMISAGATHTCAIAEDAAAYCWGRVDGSGVGPSRVYGNTPALVEGGHTYVSIDAGGDLTCGVTTEGKGLCWGRNDHGQLGNGANTNMHTPVEVSGDHEFTHISAGGLSTHVHACGITTTGAVYCWGRGVFGQLGAGGGNTTSNTPLAVTGGHLFTSITAGRQHTCGVTVTNVAMCWGNNSNGRLGIASTNPTSTPQPVVPPASGFILRW